MPGIGVRIGAGGRRRGGNPLARIAITLNGQSVTLSGQILTLTKAS